jgi:hypothetical protein
LIDPDTPVTLLFHELSTLVRHAGAGEDPDLLLVEHFANSQYLEPDDE